MLNSEGTIQRRSAFQGPEIVLTVPEVNREPRGTHTEGSMQLRAEHTWGLRKNSPRTDGSCSIHAEEFEAFLDLHLASFFEMRGVNIRDTHVH